MATLATIIKFVGRASTVLPCCGFQKFFSLTLHRQFPEETRPHSVMLIQGLVPMWGRLADASLAEDDDDQALLCMYEARPLFATFLSCHISFLCQLLNMKKAIYLPALIGCCRQTCLQCILEIVDLLIESPEVYPAVEPSLMPLVRGRCS